MWPTGACFGFNFHVTVFCLVLSFNLCLWLNKYTHWALITNSSSKRAADAKVFLHGTNQTFQMCGWTRHVLLTALNDMLTITVKGIIKRSNKKVSLSVTLMGIQRNGSKVDPAVHWRSSSCSHGSFKQEGTNYFSFQMLWLQVPGTHQCSALSGWALWAAWKMHHSHRTILIFWNIYTRVFIPVRATRRVQTNTRAK